MSKPVITSSVKILIFPLILQLLVSISLLFFPVTRYFSYESAVIHSFMLFLLSGYLYLYLGGRREANPAALIIGIAVLFSIEPLVRLAHSFFTEGCSYVHGIRFYLIGGLPAVAASFYLVRILQLFLQKFVFVAFLAILLLILLEPLLQFYFLSQIHFYNPVIFYFPGTIYDELIKPDTKLFLHRFISVAGFAALYFLLLKITGLKLRILVILLSIGFYYYTIAPLFGFITTSDHLKRNGYTITETENFVIVHPAGITREKKKMLTAYHEFQWAELREKLHLQGKEKVRSFIYRNYEDKGRLFGSENADVAKPWKREIHTSLSSVFRNLRHELAHVAASEFSNPPFYVAGGINPWLIEGLAVYASFSFDDQDIPVILAAFSGKSHRDTSRKSGTQSFFTANTRYAYLKAGLIFNKVNNDFGAEKVKELYQTGDFTKILGKNSEQLFAEAMNELTVRTVGRDSVAAEYYFRAKPFLLKICPRYLAERFESAAEEINKGNSDAAETILRELLTRSREPQYILTYAALLEKKKRYAEILDLLAVIGEEASDINIKLKRSDIQLLNGEKVSEEMYGQLLSNSPNLRFDAVIKTRIFLYKQGVLKDYISAGDSLKREILISQIKDSTGYLLYPLLSLTSGAEVLRMSEEFPLKNVWTEYCKLMIARRSLAAGVSDEFISALEKTNPGLLPSGSLNDYHELMRFRNYLIVHKNSKEE
ncbi:MAG: hypothetical protein FMNOHCHN_02315 [Ignavibacteriaceae bacterium]|nr:hypothetical protein [Ignavibacteriaceae bacterium]